ncbi:RNA polymerase sigma factor [Hymenobacter chitinivorans]|uniref:RNA polymerase sigma-70 factor (ECF subfamily) n=1 Tax=Hymenobacter chitinivorans DSM 11115 TaxID=1121954 RepID=A0A2M9BSQ7_9BACT|nr:sigma-70 family RNA polymerase sigma factor [Hymenobacter chitinivorans]PJJ60984.1 RNA polymerase sigma-70 factor (ECF subfamily) [Hymenobacter chitinivorans DSM 11115]
MATDNLLELLERIRNDDYQAFELLFEAQWRDLYRYAHKVLRDAPDAEDLTQELFCDLWANRGQLRVRTNAAGYLLGALRKKILTRFRDADIRARHHKVIGAAQEPGAELTFRRLVSQDTLQAIQHQAQGLPPKEKEVFLLGMVDDFSVKEIAERFATSEQTVRNQLSSALHKLSPFLTKLLS